MVQSTLALVEVDEARVTLIMDNAIDVLMASSDVARRLPLGPNPFERPPPMAEHGFSALITVKQGDKQGRVLFDTSVSRRGLLNNLDVLEINAADIQAIILSHGHADHTSRRASRFIMPNATIRGSLIR